MGLGWIGCIRMKHLQDKNSIPYFKRFSVDLADGLYAYETS